MKRIALWFRRNPGVEFPIIGLLAVLLFFVSLWVVGGQQ